MKIPSSSGLSFYLVMLCNFFVFFLLIFLLHFYSNPFPFSDEWHFIPQAIGVEPLTWDWVWAQHSDHRIPLQKIIQVSLLRLGGYNLSFLIIANAILIFITTSILIFAVRIYRGSSQFGDLIIPLILMNPGFGPFLWSFHFQFMSSTLLSLLFLAFFLTKNMSLRNTSYITGSICILLLALCGMNGVFSSIIVSFLFLSYIIWARPISKKFALYTIIIILALALVVALFIIGNWNPTGETITQSSTLYSKIHNIMTSYFYLINPRPIIMPGKQLYFIFNSTLYIIALGFLANKLWEYYQINRSFFIIDFVFLVILIASFGVQLSIAIGRAEYWSPGLEMHYGYLASVLPIVSWIVVSVYAPRKMGITIGLFLVLLYGYLYVENLKWRMVYVKEYRQKVLDVVNKDIMNGIGISDFVKKHNHVFYHVDNDDSRQTVKSAIIILKKANIEPYVHLQLD